MLATYMGKGYVIQPWIPNTLQVLPYFFLEYTRNYNGYALL